MVRVGGGWVALDEFLVKNDPCRAKGEFRKCVFSKFFDDPLIICASSSSFLTHLRHSMRVPVFPCGRLGSLAFFNTPRRILVPSSVMFHLHVSPFFAEFPCFKNICFSYHVFSLVFLCRRVLYLLTICCAPFHHQTNTLLSHFRA